MQAVLTVCRSSVTLGFAILYLANIFLKSGILDIINIILIIAVLLLSLPVITGTTRFLVYLFFIVSAAMFIYFRAPLDVWEKALKDYTYIAVMFILVPLLSIPIRYGGYFETLKALFMRYVNSNSSFYLVISMICAFVGVLVNMAVVPVVYQISQASERSADKKLLSSAISRGFSSCTLWAPTMISIALVLQLTGASWTNFFPVAFLCGSIIGLVGYLMVVFEYRGQKEEEGSNLPPHDIVIKWRKVIELGFFVVALVVLVAVISAVTGIQTITVVSLGCLVFPLLWLAVIAKLPVYIEVFKTSYFSESLPKIKNEVTTVMSAGFLATAITYSHLGDYVPKFLFSVMGSNVYLLMTLIVAVALLIAGLGVHPIILITVIGKTIQPAAFGVSPTFMALVLAICWTMGTIMSPASGNVIAVSGLVDRSPLFVGLRWNGPYGIIGSAVLLAFIFALRSIGII